MPSMVALDIETTGLDPQRDAILEIGIVRFSGHRIEAEYSQLINPGRPIPPVITQLTGITNEMVRNAPPIKAVLQNVSDFIGNDPVVGHNVQFDLSFMRKQNILKLNQSVDTYELAAITLPSNSRYNLGTLGQTLGILIPNSHRALDDARLAHAVLQQLYQKVVALPYDILSQIVRMSESLQWDGSLIFEQALREHARQGIEARKAAATELGALFKSPLKVYPPLIPAETPTPLNIEEMSAKLEYGGPFARYFDSFESRPQQIEMLRAIAKAFSEGQHLMVEAGTGTGKSFAYLIPAVEWALQNSTRVVISTNTITLQDQLIKKDIPDLAAALGSEVRAVVVKGRSNYLCPRRFEMLRKSMPESVDELRVLAKVLVWLDQGGSGDRSEINLNGPSEREVWSRISAEDEGCKAEVCMARTGGVCPFYRMHMAAQSAHVLVVNHALLLADVITGSRVLPEYDYLIVDEAHHLEEASTNALSFKINQMDLVRLLREIGGSSSGLLGRLLTLLSHEMRPSDFAALNQTVHKLTDLLFKLENEFTNFVHSMELFMEEQRDGQPLGGYGQQIRIVSATRTLPVWSEVEIAWDNAESLMQSTLSLLTDFIETIGNILDEPEEQVQDTLGSLSSLRLRLGEDDEYLNKLVNKPDADYVYWVELLPNNFKLTLQAAPLHVGPLMEQYLWHEKTCVVLTSATLTTNGEFDYLRSRLNADEALEIVLGSPFDYENSTLLYLCNDVPEPAEAGAYQRMIEQTLVRLAKATHGRMLALFTSYAQLRKTSVAIAPALTEADIQVYEQGEGASTNTLLETFRGAEQAVLLGTRAFWEGVDIPGQALSVLAIIKLPFDVPSDPIIAARSETFDDPFNEYSLPEAILRFRQGFGRLIRTQSDRGVVAILDRRIITKRYGRQFIESLPTCTLKVASVAELPSAAAKWLD